MNTNNRKNKEALERLVNHESKSSIWGFLIISVVPSLVAALSILRFGHLVGGLRSVFCLAMSVVGIRGSSRITLVYSRTISRIGTDDIEGVYLETYTTSYFSLKPIPTVRFFLSEEKLRYDKGSFPLPVKDLFHDECLVIERDNVKYYLIVACFDGHEVDQVIDALDQG